MKKTQLILLLVIGMILPNLLFGCGSNKSSIPDEGNSESMEETTWIDSSNNKHTATFYTNGKSAEEVLSASADIKLNHIIIDDIPVYEMYSENNENEKMVFLFHGQGSRKEEYLFEMLNYVDAGYFCVTVDLCGHGERLTKEAVMSVQLTVDTAKDIDTLLEYYHTNPAANTNKFALIGLSQGGSVCYWYAAYGKHVPYAMVIGSSTPDYRYQDDKVAFKNGESEDSIWSEEEFDDFIESNNPINETEKLINLPILAGNGLKDPIVSYKGSELLEKAKIAAGHVSSQFFYYENMEHEVPESFMMKAIPFLDNAYEE